MVVSPATKNGAAVGCGCHRWFRLHTTIAKVLDRLCEKGLLVRARDGTAFVYQPAVDRTLVERARMKQVLGRILSPEAPQVSPWIVTWSPPDWRARVVM